MDSKIADDLAAAAAEIDRWSQKEYIKRWLGKIFAHIEFPNDERCENARIVLRAAIQRCESFFNQGDFASIEREMNALHLALEKLTRPIPPRTRHDEIKTFLNALIEHVWNGLEISELESALREGEKIQHVDWFEVKTDQRVITRDEIHTWSRPISVDDIEAWNRQFPSRREIERAADAARELEEKRLHPVRDSGPRRFIGKPLESS